MLATTPKPDNNEIRFEYQNSPINFQDLSNSANGGIVITMSSMPLLTVRDLKVRFKTTRGLLEAVNGASFDIKKGELYGIVGESGSGKSVTALSILDILPPNALITEGQILFKGSDLLTLKDRDMRAIRGNKISMVFQDALASFDPVFTIANQIGEAVRIHRKMNNRQLSKHIESLLTSVGIPEPKSRKDQYPHQFSGGMKQRAMSAMALSNNPELIIADEPTTSLDVTIQAQLMDLFKDLKDRLGISILLITHDMGLIAEVCDRVSVMYGGFILETADVFSLFRDPKHPYTRGLIDSIPSLDKDAKTLISIPGKVPDPLELPSGCVFEPRCSYATEICSHDNPPLLDLNDGTKVACYRVQKEEI
jgi:peptide/nickel transport system ATP-binding protein